ncbi:hypothetical protein ACQZV8_01075 [Magnetococcales bacterium HHB-1]
MTEYLNLIPIFMLAFFVAKALIPGLKREHTDFYFKKKGPSRGKYCNWFGVPYQKDPS